MANPFSQAVAEMLERIRESAMLALGVDSSAQSCSAMVIDTAGRSSESSVSFDPTASCLQRAPGLHPGGADGEVHSDPRMWLDAPEMVLEELGQQCDLSQIAAISGAGSNMARTSRRHLGKDRLRSLQR